MRLRTTRGLFRLALLLVTSSASAQPLPTAPEAPLRLLRDGERPAWGLADQEKQGFLRLLEEGRFEPGSVVTALPRSLRETADWKGRLRIPEDPVTFDGVGYFDEFRTLWQTDGTRLGTHAVAELPYYQFVDNGGGARRLARLGDALFILAGAEPRDEVLLRWDGERVTELRRWQSEGSKARASGFSQAGGFLWFGVSWDLNAVLYRVDDGGVVRAVRDTSGEGFQGMFEVGSRTVAVEARQVSVVQDAGSDAPSFESLSGLARQIEGPKRTPLDDGLWFVEDRGRSAALFRTDGTREGTTQFAVEDRIERSWQPVRRDRVILNGELRDMAGRRLGFVATRHTPVLVTEDGIFVVRAPIEGGQADPRVPAAIRIDVETGAEEIVQTSSSGVELRWIDTGEKLFLEALSSDSSPTYRQWNGTGLDAPIVVQVRGQDGREDRLVGLVGDAGLVSTSWFGQESSWIDRASGEKRLTSRAQFAGSADGAAVFFAGDAVASTVYRFDPGQDPEPVRVRSFVGQESAFLGFLGDELVVQRGPSFQAEIWSLHVGDGSFRFVATNDPTAAPPFFESLLLTSRNLWLRGLQDQTETLARWRPGLDAPETAIVLPEDFNVGPIPVGDGVWAIEARRRAGSEWERRFHVLSSPSFDPEAPRLVLPAGDWELEERVFEILRGDPIDRALVQVRPDLLVHLGPDEARVIDGLPDDIELEEAVLTDWGAYVLAGDLDHGLELYRLVEPELGNRAELVDIAPGPAGSNPSDFTAAFGGHVFFADDGVHGQELWFDDGDQARMVCDLVPGPLSGAEALFGLLADDDGVYLRVDTGERGRALWRVAKEVVLGDSPCPKLDVLQPRFAEEPEADPSDDRAGALAGREGGCRTGGGGAQGALLVALALMGCALRRRCLSRRA